MVSIRQFKPKDQPTVEQICLLNAGNPKEPKKQEYLLNMYCRYYIEQEPSNCFVAVNEEKDAVVGYVICAENFAKYRRVFRKLYLPKIRGPKKILALGEIRLHGLKSDRFPAHMHIDILETCQRQGVGHRLIDALAESMKAKDVPGLSLVCGSDNEKGCAFYRKYGFRELLTIKTCVKFGLKIS
jgi:ribosomal protein S18 acetylase RimI-like enzyme